MNLWKISRYYSNEEASAKIAKLKYVSDEVQGYRRNKKGKGFAFLDTKGDYIKSKDIKNRIKSLAIPPAWQDVWICTDKEGHIQATGYDDKNRKQYIYHPKWREIRNLLNFYRMVLFGKLLPKIRRKVKKDLNKKGLPKEKILAAVVEILDKTYIRIGNDEYADSNSTYGLTTLTDDHARIKGSEIEFEFKGKLDKENDVLINDKKLAQIVKASKDIPGERLFQYIDKNGQIHKLTSADVNKYLQEIAGHNFTAKDFRTWGGTVLTFVHLKRNLKSEKKDEEILTEGIEKAANKLNNTKSVCKKHYIHPHILKSWEEGTFEEKVRIISGGSKKGLNNYETNTIKFLENYFDEEFGELLDNAKNFLNE